MGRIQDRIVKCVAAVLQNNDIRLHHPDQDIFVAALILFSGHRSNSHRNHDIRLPRFNSIFILVFRILSIQIMVQIYLFDTSVRVKTISDGSSRPLGRFVARHRIFVLGILLLILLIRGLRHSVLGVT